MENKEITKPKSDSNPSDKLLARTNELVSKGIDFSQAFKTAWLEHRISIWKDKWGNNFWILIYGDFEPPVDDYKVSPIGITIHSEKIEKSVVSSSARCVLKATVEIDEITVPSLMDAINRITILLGSWVLVTWEIRLAVGGLGLPMTQVAQHSNL